VLLLLLACSQSPVEPPPAEGKRGPDACDVMATPAPGPLQAERDRAATDPLALARVRIREARLTGDPGFYTLAESAVDCAMLRDPQDLAARRLRVHLLVQFHKFAEAEAAAQALQQGPTKSANVLDYALYGDALMEQGKLDEAGVAYQAAVDIRPGLEMYDRIGWLRWLWGDVKGAFEMQALAVSAGSSLDPEPLAWVLTRMGWLHAITGQSSPQIDAALAALPDYPAAHFARGRVRLAAGDVPGAIEDLKKAGPTVEATRALAEAGATDAAGRPVAVSAVAQQDPRGYAIFLSDSQTLEDRKKAVDLLTAEVETRRDAVTLMALAYARFRSGSDHVICAAQARSVLATGIVEPRVLLQAGLILGATVPISDDARALLGRALDSGPGLLPSEQAMARAAMDAKAVK